MQKITPFLWFNDNAEDAVNFYMTVFKNSKITNLSRYGEAGPGKPGSVMVVAFELDGMEFTAINGGPHYQMNGAISFVVDCKDQAEVDYYWDKLSAGGQVHQCAWLTDKFGVTWQIVPDILGKLLGGDDSEGADRAMAAMLKMVKLDIAELQRAYDGK